MATADQYPLSLHDALPIFFSIIGIEIRQELNLSEFQYGVLIATPVLTGSIIRIVLGVWTERYGGRLVFALQMILTGIATLGLAYAHSYFTFLLAALGVDRKSVV